MSSCSSDTGMLASLFISSGNFMSFSNVNAVYATQQMWRVILASLPDSVKGKEMKTQKFRIPMLTMCLLALLALVLAACGGNSDQGSTGTTPPKAQSTPTPTPSPAATATGTPGVAQGSCGSISNMLRGAPASGTSTNSDPQQVGNCFWSAYQQCRPASLNYVTGGVDTILTRTFQTQKTASGSCQVQDKIQMRVLPRPPKTTAVYTCTSVEMQATELQFRNCQKDGTINIFLK
ncbi:hypothetical protein KDH_25110 [Dictyobacter sp. S3.2.2.5]|uniref:Lipoprotein n=1 Tax=Dictyobacter halimunensis TaxID=3026934 RepID=A0ABQ6FRM1_9CHLR|nr:hypothetical protein KDH_25110 [Dictyobacter sp. S3.2.2.5]